MSHHDNPRDLPPGGTDRDRFEPVTPEPLVLPTPEPLVPAEPPPAAHPAGSAGAGHLEPSWRALVGGRQADVSPEDSSPQDLGRSGGNGSAAGVRGPLFPGEVPPSGGPPAGPYPSADTTVGTLGDEPMGGVPREPPAGPASSTSASGETPAPLLPRQEPHQKVTLSRIGEELFAWLKTLASAAVYATLIVTFGFQVARVEGQSMAPTLADQDRLIVNKLAYRIGEPQVGDIVMLYYPLNPEKSFVKRVIAEEGDQIRIVDGRVYRNDVPIHDDYVPPEFRSHDDYGPEVVPQGYYFVMGDHRNNSSDSRHWKFVPKKYIIGKVQLRWWPIPAARIF